MLRDLSNSHLYGALAGINEASVGASLRARQFPEFHLIGLMAYVICIVKASLSKKSCTVYCVPNFTCSS
jgi:hypothetical protein